MLLYVKPESFRPSASASFGQQVRPVHSCEHQICVREFAAGGTSVSAARGEGHQPRWEGWLAHQREDASGFSLTWQNRFSCCASIMLRYLISISYWIRWIIMPSKSSVQGVQSISWFYLLMQDQRRTFLLMKPQTKASLRHPLRSQFIDPCGIWGLKVTGGFLTSSRLYNRQTMLIRPCKPLKFILI